MSILQDFKEQIIHHIATIFLIGFSYCANYVRVGTLVMLVHDSSDFLMEVRTCRETQLKGILWAFRHSLLLKSNPQASRRLVGLYYSVICLMLSEWNHCLRVAEICMTCLVTSDCVLCLPMLEIYHALMEKNWQCDKKKKKKQTHADLHQLTPFVSLSELKSLGCFKHLPHIWSLNTGCVWKERVRREDL